MLPKLFTLAYVILSFGSLGAQNYTPATCYGGQKQFKLFIKQEMLYPEAALKAGSEGVVVLIFIVEKDGSTRDLKVWQSLSPELDAEAIRIFKLLQWNPAIQNGSRKAMEQFLRFKFDIKQYRKYCKRRGYEQSEYPYEPYDTSLVIHNYREVEQPPEPMFADSSYTLHKFFYDNIKYPESAFQQNISGTVKLKFIIETTGRISNIKITKMLGAGCSEEVKRIFKALRWMPAIHEGKAVRTQMHFAVKFDMTGGYQYVTYTNLHSI